MAIARYIPDGTIKLKTGKHSSEWYEVIDRLKTKNHTQIAKFLGEEYMIGPWWSQIITNRYEWERGLRDK